MNTNKLNNNKSLLNYDNIEAGDLIEFPTSFLLVKSGVVASMKKLNGNAAIVTTTTGHKFPISKWNTNYTLTQI